MKTKPVRLLTCSLRGQLSGFSIRYPDFKKSNRLSKGTPVHRPDGLAMLMSPKKGETAAQVISVLIIGEVIQAVSRQVSSIIRSKIAKR